MTYSKAYNFSKPSLISKISCLELHVQQMLEKYQDILTEVQLIDNESQSYQEELIKQKQQCESKTCSGAQELRIELATKTNIIDMAASLSIKLNETKNLSLITELLKTLCGDFALLTPPKDSPENKENNLKDQTPKKRSSKKIKLDPDIKQKISPKKEATFECSAEDISFKEESISEIDGTPGRTSPIIGSKKLKSSSSANSTSESSNNKNETDWSSPQGVKLVFCAKNTTKGKGKPRQSRLTTYVTKATNVVDLTCSPDTCTGFSWETLPSGTQNPKIKLLIKQESSDTEDTILPSPTSSANADHTSKPSFKDSQKFKKPALSLKKEILDDDVNSPIISVVDKKLKENSKVDNFEESINILQPKRFKSPFKNKNQNKSPFKSPFKNQKGSPLKKQPSPIFNTVEMSPPVGSVNEVVVKLEVPCDETHCDDSGLQTEEAMDVDLQKSSPAKQPLAENRNVVNVEAMEDSVSLLLAEAAPAHQAQSDKPRGKYAQAYEPVYKEPAVRKKAEKMKLPGWCCDDCVNFFGDLYASDPAKIAAVVARCSKHRGRSNPARPRTPPGFWDPRWDVPHDTEEFNRRNHAV